MRADTYARANGDGHGRANVSGNVATISYAHPPNFAYSDGYGRTDTNSRAIANGNGDGRACYGCGDGDGRADGYRFGNGIARDVYGGA